MRRGKRKPVPLRVVVDVNVLISFLIGKRLGGFLPLLRDGRVTFLISPPLLAEFVDVAARAKFRVNFPVERAHDLALALASFGENVAVEAGSSRPLFRDPKDDYLLMMSDKGNADVLVTGDKGLLSLERFGDTRIMNAREVTEEYLTARRRFLQARRPRLPPQRRPAHQQRRR